MRRFIVDETLGSVQNPISSRIKNIQALRGVAVLLVVFFHMVTIEKKYGGTNTLLPDYFQFGMFGVDLFFVISGFVMVTVTRGKFQQPRQAVTFLYHRISRIYPLYWFYSLLVLAVFLLHPSFVNSSQFGQVNILASFLLLPQKHLPLLMVGWTLVHEMYFYLVFFLLLFLPEKHLVKSIGFWTAIILFLQLYITSDSPLALRLISHPLTIEFVGGCLLALCTRQNKGTLSAPFFLISALFIFAASILSYILYLQTTGQVEPAGWWRILIMGIPAILIIFCLVRAEQRNVVLPRLLGKIGDASYSIYLSHVLTLSLIGRIWAEFSSDSTADNWFALPFMLLSVVAVGYISYVTVERPMIAAGRKIA